MQELLKITNLFSILRCNAFVFHNSLAKTLQFLNSNPKLEISIHGSYKECYGTGLLSKISNLQNKHRAVYRLPARYINISTKSAKNNLFLYVIFILDMLRM